MGSHSRDELVSQAMEHTNWDLLACVMPGNVLLLSGYWPAMGHSLALVTRAGKIMLIAPDDDRELAEHSWADEVITYSPAPLDRLLSAEESLYETLLALKHQLSLNAARIGFEQSALSEPAGYSPHLSRGNAVRLLRHAFPAATLAPADEMLAELRTTKTPAEIQHIRTACRIAERGFQEGAGLLRAGLTEAQAASVFRVSLTSCIADFEGVGRCDGFVTCVSGPDSSRAGGPFGRSRSRSIGEGDLVVFRSHSYCDGYWADISRTYHLGRMDSTKRRMFDAVLAAGDAALKAIRPGAFAREVDGAARAVLESLGLGAAFTHPAGYGAGFAATDFAARPRLHPKSEDVLETGMVLKLESGVYVNGIGGVRKTDMVAVTDGGPEVLTQFHWDVHQAEIGSKEEANAI